MLKVYHTVTLISENDTIEVETVSDYDNFTAQELARHAKTLLRHKFKMAQEEVDKFTRFKIRKGRKA